jgi:UDP-4-amino-4,6-dideoxy-N-acetyl-beta-L-altrosamine transaminase
MSTSHIPYGKQEITAEDLRVVAEALQSDFLTQGPKVKEFEEKFAEYIGAKYAVAVSNGTAALHLCTMALNVNEQSKVITSPNTFAASANCVRYCGGEVWFSDIDPETFTLDIEALETLLKAHPAGTFQGVVLVDFAGYPVNLEDFKKLAEKHNLWIIEDACHAPGAWFKDSSGIKQRSGNGQFADLAIFSFHPVKHIATGEGGMITTNNEDLYKKLMLLRTHGITRDPQMLTENHGGWYYEMQELGYNYRIPDVLCALGISQLARADKGLERRNAIARRYDEELKGLPVILPKRTDDIEHAFHLYVIRTEKRKDLYDFLRTKNIFCQIHYIPVHTMPYYRQFGWKQGDMPVAEQYYSQCLSIPMYPSLTDEQQTYVIDSIRSFFEA